MQDFVLKPVCSLLRLLNRSQQYADPNLDIPVKKGHTRQTFAVESLQVTTKRMRRNFSTVHVLTRQPCAPNVVSTMQENTAARSASSACCSRVPDNGRETDNATSKTRQHLVP